MPSGLAASNARAGRRTQDSGRGTQDEARDAAQHAAHNTRRATLSTLYSALITFRMTWLATLPHQIPFRAASAAVRVDDATIEGVFVCTANDPLPFPILAVEAMAQLAGGLAFHETRGHGLLNGVDGCTLDRPIEPGEIVRFSVKMSASFGGIFRFTGTGSVDGVEVIRGKFYLAAPSTDNAQA